MTEAKKELPLAMHLYRGLFIETGRVPNAMEIRFFYAYMELVFEDGPTNVVHNQHGDINSPEAVAFTRRVFKNYEKKWKDRPVMSHEEICARIEKYERESMS